MNEITLNNRLILVENLTINFDKNEICIVENDVYSESYSFLHKCYLILLWIN